MTILRTNNRLTDGRAEQIVDYINAVSEMYEEGIKVVCVERDGPPISIIIHNAALYNEIVTLGEALSIEN